MRLRLTAKLAELVDGIDLSHCVEGDVVELPEREARLLLAEKWAELVDQHEEATYISSWLSDARAVAADTRVPVSPVSPDGIHSPSAAVSIDR